MADGVYEFGQSPPIPPFLVKDVLSKIAYLDEHVRSAEISQDGSLVTITVDKRAPQDLEVALEARLKKLTIAMADGAFEPELKRLEGRKGSGSFSEDPRDELLDRREIVEEGEGYYALGPLLTSIIDFVEARVGEVARTMGARSYRFPALIAPEYLEKVLYFKNFAHSLSFCTHLRENIPLIERFACEAMTVDGRIEVDTQVYAAPQAMLSPTVCHHLYNALKETTITTPGIVATAVGNCFRYESRNMRSLERLWNFTMREIIFVGEDDFVQDRLAEARHLLYPLMDDLDLTYDTITATDPFFIGTYRDQAAYQAAFDLKYEVRASLPYKSDTLAVASYNRHGDFFGRLLEIKNSDGSSASTGCFAVGHERLALAILAQHGTDFTKWPRALRLAAERSMND